MQYNAMEDSGCDWDPEKDAENQRKHGISFEDACRVFSDPHRGETPDDRDYGEERWIATGRVDLADLVVVFADRGGRQRIIPARRAKRREEEAYLVIVYEDRLGFGARF